MKKLIFILLFLFLLNTIACKQQAKDSNFVDYPGETIEDPELIEAPIVDLYIEGLYRIPTQAEIDNEYYPAEIPFDSTLHKPHYYECKMLKNWTTGINITWYFSDNTSNYTFRFDKDGATHRITSTDYYEKRLGSCRIGVSYYTNELLLVVWEYSDYQEIIVNKL